MIQDIAPSALDNHFKPCRPAPDSPVLCFSDDGVLAATDAGTLRFPTFAELGGRTVYAFSVDADAYFLGEADACAGYERLPLYALRRAQPAAARFAAVTGHHLWRWYRDNAFCGRCGAPLRHDTRERALVCDCGNHVYPKLCPAVIVGVRHEGRLLLTRYARPHAPWSLVAGFAEIGETLEQTVAREVMEECGLRVKNIRYYGSQPWGFSGDLLAGFFCECDGDTTIRLDRTELKTAQWMTPEEITFGEDGVSLTNEMIHAFRRGSAPV